MYLRQGDENTMTFSTICDGSNYLLVIKDPQISLKRQSNQITISVDLTP